MIDHYDWAGGSEAMLRFGPRDGPVVVVAAALFEEANRTRAFLVRVLRLLGERGIGGALPDLPGQGESLVPIEEVTVLRWCEAFERAFDHVAVDRRVVGTVSIRGGALIDSLAPAPSRWQFAPVEGERLIQEMWRVGRLSRPNSRDRPDSDGPMYEAEGMVAGTWVSADVRAGLRRASPCSSGEGVPVRVVRLATDPLPANLKVPGRPLWRGSEPDVDEPLADLLASDIADWVRTCAA